MLLLDDWNEVLMDLLRKFPCIVIKAHFMKTLERIIDYQHRRRSYFIFLKMFSLLKFILSLTIRNLMYLPTWMK